MFYINNIYTMKIFRYNNFNESLINLIEDDLKRFEELGFNIKHKEILDDMGNKYNIYYGLNKDSNDHLIKMYSGKHANSLGGYAPSEQDICMYIDSVSNGNEVSGTHLIIKTNGDNIVPDEVIKQAANKVRDNSVMLIDDKKYNLKNVDKVNIVFFKKDFFKTKNNTNLDENNNKRYVVISADNIKITDQI